MQRRTDLKPNKTTFIQIWNSQYSLQAFVLSIILFIIDIFTRGGDKTIISNILGLLIFSLIFTAFDVTGWYGIVKTLSLEYSNSSYGELSPQDWRKKYAIASYRIMQSCLHIILLGFIFIYWGYICLIACIVSWWFLADDLLYYLLCKEKLTLTQEINWVDWSIWVIPKTLHKDVRLYGRGFIIIGIIGFLIGIGVCFL